MAVWQCDVLLVPRRESDMLLRRANTLSYGVVLAEDDVDRPWWRATQPPADFAERLSAIVPRARAWSDDLWMWGTDDADRIDILFDAGRVCEVKVRIDMRSFDENLLLALADLAKHFDCHFLRVDGTLATGDFDHLLALVTSSPAFRFTEDPARFLNRLRVGGIDDA